MAKPLDKRGYAGSERNRALDPEQVIWARAAHFNGEVTARQLASQWGMSVDSVRRMLRGETYGNVGQAMPVREDPAGVGNVQESLKRLLEQVEPPKAGEFKPPESEPPEGLDPFANEPASEGEDNSHESAIDAFLNAKKGSER